MLKLSHSPGELYVIHSCPRLARGAIVSAEVSCADFHRAAPQVSVDPEEGVALTMDK